MITLSNNNNRYTVQDITLLAGSDSGKDAPRENTISGESSVDLLWILKNVK